MKNAMNNTIKQALKLVTVLFLLNNNNLKANVIKTSGTSGNFNSNSTWNSSGSNGTVKYIIKAGDNVSVNINSNGFDTIVVEGTLTINNNISLNMNATGTIIIKAGGIVTGGSSNSKISWNSGSTGVISGPWNGANTQTGPSYANINTLAFVTLITPLPVTVIDFKATQQNNTVKVEWMTTSETNSSNFTVQSSTDGLVWRNIGTLEAAGNSYSAHNYVFIDQNPFAGENYYRFIQKDADNKMSISEILFVQFNESSRSHTANIYPNPCSAQVNVALQGVEVTAEVSITLSNSFGQVIETPVASVFGIYTIDTQNLNEGIYFITVQSEGFSTVKQISVKH